MAKERLNPTELRDQLNDQLVLLQALCKMYDEGTLVAAKSIATSIRLLLHDTSSSKSLLGLLDLKKNLFCSTAELMVEYEDTVRAGTFAALVGVPLGGSGAHDYIPYYNSGPSYPPRMILFDEYWNELVIKDFYNEEFTRRDLVLYVSHQDGGAHVDPSMDDKYKALAKKNSLGWKLGDGINIRDLNGAELASIRQIAHEILLTLIPGYTFKAPDVTQMGVIGGGGILLHYESEDSKTAVRRKGPCPCGSGKKYKRCCGK